MEEDDEKLRLIIGVSRTRLEDTVATRAAHYFLRREYESSLRAWQKLESMKSRPKDVTYETLDGASRCLLNLNRYEEALAYAQRLVTSAPTDGSAWTLHGTILRKKGDDSGAIVSYLKALSGPHPPRLALLELAELYKSLGEPWAVKFLLRRLSGHSHGSKLPSSRAAVLGERIAALESWAESSAREKAAGLSEDSSAPSQSEEVGGSARAELEVRFFGCPIVQLSLNYSEQTQKEELDTSDIRDPSQM